MNIQIHGTKPREPNVKKKNHLQQVMLESQLNPMEEENYSKHFLQPQQKFLN